MKAIARPLIMLASITLLSYSLHAQVTIPNQKKGSYLYYGQPKIEDNSMFIEEAFNQERRIIQHISNLIFDESGSTYYYTNEIPLADYWHQFSFTASYTNLKTGTSGLGDLLINYRPLLKGKNDWALIIPRFTLILPTGNAKLGLGDGGLGGQFNLAVTKRLNRKFTTHWNAGYSFIGNAKTYTNIGGETILESKRNLNSMNFGLGTVFVVSNNFNLMTEYTFTSERDRGVITNTSIVNPGFRFAFNVNNTQIVPGLGLPVYGTNGDWKQSGFFLYLSIEPDYTKD